MTGRVIHFPTCDYRAPQANYGQFNLKFGEKQEWAQYRWLSRVSFPLRGTVSLFKLSLCLLQRHGENNSHEVCCAGSLWPPPSFLSTLCRDLGESPKYPQPPRITQGSSSSSTFSWLEQWLPFGCLWLQWDAAYKGLDEEFFRSSITYQSS